MNERPKLPARPRRLTLASILVGVLAPPGFLVFGWTALFLRREVDVLPALLAVNLVGLGMGFWAWLEARRIPVPRPSPPVAGAVLNALALAAGVLLVGPQLARSLAVLDEAGAQGDLRAIDEAQNEYARVNGGFYDRLECLAAPARCIPSYPAPEGFFLAYPLPEHGYLRTFTSGPAAPPDAIRRAHASPSSITSYAYVAIPKARSRGRGGFEPRGFCSDSTGVRCETTDGSAPPVVDGRCVVPCRWMGTPAGR